MELKTQVRINEISSYLLNKFNERIVNLDLDIENSNLFTFNKLWILELKEPFKVNNDYSV
jgi:hypothetical protein